MDIITNLTDFLSQPWLWYVLGAGVLYAIGNYIDEGMVDDLGIPVGTLVINSGIFGFLIAGGFAIYAWYTGTTILMSPGLILKSLFIGVLEMTWVIPYLYATQRRGAIVAGPLFQLVPVLALGFEAMYGIVPPLLQILGALLIVAGGVILSIEEDEDDDGEVTKHFDIITFGLMLLATFLVAFIYVIFKDTALDGNFVAVGFWTGIGIGLTGLIIYLVWQPYRKVANEFWGDADWRAVFMQLVNEVFDAAGVYLTHLANILGPSVMVVTAFGAAQPLFIGLIGMLIFGFQVLFLGRKGRVSWGMILLIAAAITLIASGTVLVAIE